MSGLLTRVVFPLLALVLVVSAIWIMVGQGWVPETVGYWLWPALIAFLLLIALLVVLLLRMHLLLWPLGRPQPNLRAALAVLLRTEA